MSDVYERALEEISQLEERLKELQIFIRMYDKLAKYRISLSRTLDDHSKSDPQRFSSRDFVAAEGNGPSAKPESETETERLAKLALAGQDGMRIRELYGEMVRLGYEPTGQKPSEVLRHRLVRSRLIHKDGGVFSLRQEA